MPPNDASATTISPERASARPVRPSRERSGGRLRTSFASASTKSARGRERLARSSPSRSSSRRFLKYFMCPLPGLPGLHKEIPPVAGKPLQRTCLPSSRPGHSRRDDLFCPLAFEDRPEPVECAMERHLDGVRLRIQEPCDLCGGQVGAK